MQKYPHLFSPLKIGGITLKNRIEASPMNGDSSPTGYLTDAVLATYEARAMGGAAIVTHGETVVHIETGGAHFGSANLDQEKFMPTHLDFVDRIHQHNALASIEIAHCGMHANPALTKGGLVYGPSAQKGERGTDVLPLDEDMMNSIADAFAHGAYVAKCAGFDMVMLHGGHGWIFSEFLSGLYNHRTDRYGGSLENRARFPLMVIDRIRQAVGKDFPIEYRMSGSEFIEGGFTQEEGIEFAKMIDGKVDLIHVSAMTFHDPNADARMFPCSFLPRGCNAFLAAEIKKHVKTPVATVGGFNSPEMMEEFLASGQADVIAVARQFLADPFFPRKIQEGKEDEVRPCIRCNHCMSLDFPSYTGIANGNVRCSVNPTFGKELYEFAYRPAPVPKKVLVIGGGPGGMQAAITAAEAGHDVTLCEKSSRLGGMLITASEDIPFKKDLYDFMQYLIRMTERKNVKICCNTEVTPEYAAESGADVIISAVGAEPLIPPIPGIDHEKVVTVTELHDRKKELLPGQKAVVIGGGLAGCEEGLAMAMAGVDVTIIEMRDEMAKDAPVPHRNGLLLEFAKYPNLHTVTEAKCTRVDENGAVYVEKDGKECSYTAELVLLSAGMKARKSASEEFRNCVSQFIEVGDCKKAGKVLEAVKDGYYAGKNLSYPPLTHQFGRFF